MDRPSVAIVIPAYNEEGTIARVVAEVLAHGQPIVVDDASGDRTRQAAEEAGAVVVRHEANQGYDGALNSGFAEAERRGFEYVVTLDADGQHDASLIRRFVELLQDSCDLVVGIRPARARWGEKVFCFVARHVYGLRDPLCGMKGYRMSLYRRRGHFDCYRSIGTELSLFAARKRLQIAQVPVPILHRTDGATRFGRSWKAEWKILRALLRGLVARS